MASRVLFRLMSQFNAAKNYYQTLGLPTSATALEVKKAYHDLARIYHPDAKTGNEAKFKDIAEAFEVLSDEQLRNQYNSARNPRERQEEQFQQGQGQAKEQQGQAKGQWKYRGADPFGGFEGRKSPFEQASWEEKAKRAAESHEKWQRNARRSPPIDFSPWGKRGNPYHRSPNSDKGENRPDEAWIYELMAFGILLTLGYWSIKALYALLFVRPQHAEMVIDPEPVFRQVQRRNLEQETGPLPRARVSRSRWQEGPGTPPQSP